jgi:hypothetical protein
MTLDIIGAIGLTASAATVVAGLVTGATDQLALRFRIALAFAAWFALMVAAGAIGVFDNRIGIGTPAIGAAVLIPVLLVAYAGARLPGIASAVSAIPTPFLIGVNCVRILGVLFLLLHADRQLSAPFAPSAGWGDILVGVAALPVAFQAVRQTRYWRVLTLAWNSFGLLDLIVAIGLGVTSAPGSPIRLFFTEPGTVLMGTLPWVLTPAFIVPLLILTHLELFHRLLAPVPAAHAA